MLANRSTLLKLKTGVPHVTCRTFSSVMNIELTFNDFEIFLHTVHSSLKLYYSFFEIPLSNFAVVLPESAIILLSCRVIVILLSCRHRVQ